MLIDRGSRRSCRWLIPADLSISARHIPPKSNPAVVAHCRLAQAERSNPAALRRACAATVASALIELGAIRSRLRHQQGDWHFSATSPVLKEAAREARQHPPPATQAMSFNPGGFPPGHAAKSLVER